jgi:hypothetical protein
MKYIFSLGIIIVSNIFAQDDTYVETNLLKPNSNDLLVQRVHNYEMSDLLGRNFVALDDELDKDYITQNYNLNSNLSSSQRNILEDTAYVQVAMITTIGALLLLPQSITNWDPNTLNDKPLDEKWKEHVAAGPVIDEDDAIINYVGHPVSGAIYYTMARNDGLSPFNSFLFSTLMSSFFWEYGYEAFAEVPSIQDLISTPLIGSFMGEGMHYLEGKLDENHGLIWNSRYLGNISYFFLDPMGNMAHGIEDFLDLQASMHFTAYQENAYMYQNNYDIFINKPYQFRGYNYGIVLDIRY